MLRGRFGFGEEAKALLLLLGELKDLAHGLHHGLLGLPVVLLLHEGYQVLGDHPAIYKKLALCLLLLGLLEELARLVAYSFVFTLQYFKSFRILSGLLLLDFELFFKIMVFYKFTNVDFDLFL